MNAKGIFGSRLIEEQMCGNMTGILLRIYVRNAYLSSCLRKSLGDLKHGLLFFFVLKGSQMKIITLKATDEKKVVKVLSEWLAKNVDDIYIKRIDMTNNKTIIVEYKENTK